MAGVMAGTIAADAGIITGGVEVGATTMVGGIIVITGDLTSISSEKPLQLAASRVGSRNQCRLLARESVQSLPLLSDQRTWLGRGSKSENAPQQTLTIQIVSEDALRRPRPIADLKTRGLLRQP